MKSFKAIAICLLFLQVLSCKKNGDETIVVRINQYKQATYSWGGPALVLSMQEGTDIGSQKWTPFLNQLDGLNYEPGYIYDLSLTRYHIDHPLQDQSSTGYRLNKVISKTKASSTSTFNIDLRYDNQFKFLIGSSSKGFSIIDQVIVDCGNLCSELEQSMASGNNALSGKFSLNANGSIKLLEIIRK